MDDELVQLLQRISQQTGLSVDELVKLAVLEFVQSFDLDFEGAGNALTYQPVEAP